MMPRQVRNVHDESALFRRPRLVGQRAAAVWWGQGPPRDFRCPQVPGGRVAGERGLTVGHNIMVFNGVGRREIHDRAFQEL